MLHTCCSGVSGVSCNCPPEGVCQDYSQQASLPVACEFEQSAASPSSLYGPGAQEQTILKRQKWHCLACKEPEAKKNLIQGRIYAT